MSTQLLLRRTLIVGVSIFTFSAFLAYVGAGLFLLYFLLLAPGLVYGSLLVVGLKKDIGFLFIIFAGLLHGLAFSLMTLRDYSFVLRLFIISSLSSASLFTLYYIMIDKHFIFLKTLGWVSIGGLLSAIPTAIFFNFIKGSTSALIGMLLIYPIWQLVFSINLYKAINERS